MKVLVVSDVLGEENNGTTIACMNLVRYLRKQGDDVRILCPDQDKKDLPNYYIVPNLKLGPIVNWALKKNQVVLARPKTKIIKKALTGVDVCHIMLPFALGVKTLKIARKMGIPCTCGFHCQAENFTAHIGLMNCKLANKMTYKHFYNNFYKYVDAIHYPTEFIRQTFESVVKRKTNAYIISNGVNDLYKYQKTERKGQLKDKFNILFIGRYSKEKSHPLLIEAVSHSKYKDHIQLVFAGQGPYAEQLKKMAISKGLNTPVMKFYSRKELVDVINSCDIYVHPAEIEIEAISCLEAIKCGLVPIISNSKRCATKAFALTENNLFDYNNPKDLAKKIDYWIEHPKEKEECSKNYLGYTNQFDQSSCMHKMREMLLTYANNPLAHTSKLKYYYTDELNDDFANNGIVAAHNKPGYRYVNKNIFYCALEIPLYHLIGKPLIYCINKFVNHYKVVNKKALKKCKGQGYFIYANHTCSLGDAFTPNLLRMRKNYIVVGEEATSIPGIKTIVKMLGAIPLPSHVENIPSFKNAIEKRIDEGSSVTIYPEAHIWPKYTKVRRFKSASFRYPVDQNAPIFTITNTWEKRKHSKKVRLVSYIDGPFYPDTSLSRKEAIDDLAKQAYDAMLKRSEEAHQYETIRYIKLNRPQTNA